MSLRIIFMGTPAFAVPTLAALVGQGHEIIAAYTRAPAPGGRRGLEPVPSPVEVAARGFGIPVLTPKTLRNEEAQAEFLNHAADVAVVVAYGLILPKPVLDAPRFGCLNLHGSLLPRWRGAAPMQRAIMAADAETGVMVMQMEEGLDTGPVGMVERVPITPATTTGMLHDQLSLLGADLMLRALAALERDSLRFTEQSAEGVTYAAKIAKEETKIDFSRPARLVLAQIHGLSPAPGAYFMIGETRLKILQAERVEGTGEAGVALDSHLMIACGEGAIRPLRVQPAGKGAMALADFLRGHPVPAGSRLL